MTIQDEAERAKDGSISIENQIYRYIDSISDELEWFKYVKIRDFTTKKVIPFKMWNHLEYVLLLLRFNQQLAILKAKQLGLSWTMAGHALYICGRGVANVLEFSKGEDEAADLLDKSRFINSEMPPWLRLRIGKDGSELITFPDTISQIRAFPSTEDAGVGQTGTLVIRDECEFHKFAEANFAHVKPTVDAGAQIVDMSTSKRSQLNTHFKSIYKRAKAGENNYIPVFLPWYYRPDRDLAWYEKTRRDYFPLWLFEQDYPTTEEDALGAIAQLGLIDKERISALTEGIKEPIYREGLAMIWHRPRPGWKYYAGGDAAEGRGGDYQVLWIEGTDGSHKELVALIHINTLDTDLFAFEAHTLLTRYGRPLLVMGNDAWGTMVLKDLATMGYIDRIYTTDPKGEKLGYTETESNKQINFAELGKSIRDGLSIPYREAIAELSAMALNDDGKYESTAPHDDLVSAAAKAVIAYNESKGESSEVDVQHFG